MSSAAIRTALQTAVETAAAPWDVFDLSDYVSLNDALDDASDQAVLLQYVAGDEYPVTIAGGSVHGWAEDATVVLHLVTAAGFDSAPVVAKGDAIREALRGTRLTNQITVHAVEPFVDFGPDATALYGGAWKGWAANAFINRRDCG